MSEKNTQKYLDLINKLLISPNEEKAEILTRNHHLIDSVLIETMMQIATEFNKQGNVNDGNWLRNLAQDLATYLDSLHPTQEYLDFLLEILRAISSKVNQVQIYYIFQKNIDKINFKLNSTLQIWSDNTFPTLRRKKKQSVGYDITKFCDLIQQFPLGNRKINIEIAITGYKIASQVFLETNLIFDWAAIQNNLGNAYSDRIAGNKKDNIELAIAFFNASLEVRKERIFPTEWATTQINLGLTYSERIVGNKKDNIELAISSLNNALRIFTEENFSLQWAAIKINLGNIYNFRIAGNKRENIEFAIDALTAALKVYTEDEFSQRWAGINNNLGNAYRQRIVGDRIENIEVAISFYLEALRVRTKRNFPVDWATTQNNLGLAYSERILGDRIDNIELAIDTYIHTLEVKTKINFPVDWAATKNNLGTAYRERITGDKIDNIKLAIASYTDALLVYTEKDFPYENAKTKTNLGNTYYFNLAGNRRDNIESAIIFDTDALKVYTEKDFPIDWATTQNNLGLAYSERITGDKIDNIELAIASYNKALRVRTEKNFPNDWAATQNNLGFAYSERILEDKKDNIQLAIRHYLAALTIYTPKSNPFECLRSARNLGNLYLNEGNYKLSVDYYDLAIEALEQSRERATTDQNRQEILSHSISVYMYIVKAYIFLGRIDKAIEYVERVKTRNLVNLLATRDLYPKGDIPHAIIDRLDSLRQAAIVEERRLSQQRNRSNDFGGFSMGDNRGLTGVIGNNEAPNRDRLNNIRQELDNLVKKDILPIDPSFQLTQKAEPISFDKIKASLPNNKTVLIEWFIGKETLSVFIVAAQREQPLLVSYSAEEYQVLFDLFSRYLDTYQQRDSQWQNQLDDLLVELAKNLKIEPIIEQIEELISDCDRLILVPHRWLHLLPIHALPLANGKCLLDLFPQGVNYAPSVQLLELTQKQSKPQLNSLFAVQNPTEDLEFTNVEVQAMRSHFQPNDDVLKKQQATKSALTKEKLGQANLAHFSCHGKFNFENPELSALLLAGSKIEQNQEGKNKGKTRFLPSRDGGSIDLDKCLTLGEIFSLDLRNCSLVTLSACETGLTDFKSLSDEYIGLPSGFLYAGSPSVVSSLWTVDDISTSFLMIKFYQNLQENDDSVVIALNQAQIWLRSVTKEELAEWKTTLDIGSQMWKVDAALINMPDGDRPYESPYYWAAFCAVGQ